MGHFSDHRGCNARPGALKWNHGLMTELWQTVQAEDVKVGDRLRTPNGTVLEVSKIEDNFFEMDTMIAFIEDTPSRWFKQPIARGTPVEISRLT